MPVLLQLLRHGQEEVEMNTCAEKSGDANHWNRESNWFQLK